jgi:hypothetical protein
MNIFRIAQLNELGVPIVIVLLPDSFGQKPLSEKRSLGCNCRRAPRVPAYPVPSVWYGMLGAAGWGILLHPVVGHFSIPSTCIGSVRISMGNYHAPHARTH